MVPAEGKVFDIASVDEEAFAEAGVESFSYLLEENVLLEYRGRQTTARLRGVDERYEGVVPVRETIAYGDYELRFGDMEQAVVGQGLAYDLGVKTALYDPLNVYAVRRGEYSSLLPIDGYRTAGLFPAGIFRLDAETDGTYVLSTLGFAQELLDYPGKASAIAVKAGGGRPESVRKKLAAGLGDDFRVMTRYEQKASMYRIMKAWRSLGIFFISLLVLVIASFSIIGSLVMLIIDKRPDIGILYDGGGRWFREAYLREGGHVDKRPRNGGWSRRRAGFCARAAAFRYHQDRGCVVSGRCLSGGRAVLGHRGRRGGGIRRDMDNKRINGIENDTQVVGKIMKALVYRLCAVLACVAALFASCRGYKQIPEETLADIFKDMYVLNAYMERNNMNLRFDSVDIYGPLIGKYGYTAEDFRQTITDATKRKSFRLTDIVEAAIAKLEAEQAAVTERVRVLDLIDSMAYAVSRREVFRDSLITIRSLADSAALTLRVPLEEGAGKVDITYYYLIDSLDGNKNLTNRHALLTDDSLVRSSSTLRMLSGRRIKHNVVLSGGEDVTELAVKFGNYPEKPKRMHLTIDSLVVVYQPPLEEARRVLSHEYGYRLMIDDREYEEYYAPKADSRALRVPSPLVVAQCDSLVVE